MNYNKISQEITMISLFDNKFSSLFPVSFLENESSIYTWDLTDIYNCFFNVFFLSLSLFNTNCNDIYY